MRVSVCTVCVMSTPPHEWELRHRPAPALCSWVTVSVAVAAQESWPPGERSFSFRAGCVGLRGDTQLPLSLVLPVWGQKTFQLLWNVQKVLCSRAVWPRPRSCTQGRLGSWPLPPEVSTCPAACHQSVCTAWEASVKRPPTACSLRPQQPNGTVAETRGLPQVGMVPGRALLPHSTLPTLGAAVCYPILQLR